MNSISCASRELLSDSVTKKKNGPKLLADCLDLRTSAMADELAALRAELARKEAALEVASLKEQLAVQDALAQQPPPEEDAGLPTVAELIQAMRAPDDELRGEAITYLCELVDCAFGDDGALLGQAVRDANGVAMLSWMLADASPRVQTQTLLILGSRRRPRRRNGARGRAHEDCR